jgi:hypothetical protein
MSKRRLKKTADMVNPEEEGAPHDKKLKELERVLNDRKLSRRHDKSDPKVSINY